MARPKPVYRLSWRVLLIAALLAAMALTVLVPVLKRRNTTTVTFHQDDSVELPVPRVAIARGERLSTESLTTIRWPKSHNRDGLLAELGSSDSFYAASPLPAGVPIPKNALRPEAPDSNAVVEAIPQGMRAITVKVDAESAVEGWAQSGNSVDVILVRPLADGGLESAVVAENIRILSAGSSALPTSAMETAPNPPNTVTLLTTQQDALKIKIASKIGQLTFALRGENDNSPSVAKTAQEKLLRSSPPPKNITFKGRATGPDGKKYLLNERSEWIYASNSAVEHLSGRAQND